MPPFISWDAPLDTKHEKVIWRGKLDDRYLVEVRPTFHVARGRITYVTTVFVFDHWSGDEEIGFWNTGFPCHALYESLNPSGWMREVEAYVDLRLHAG